MNCQKFLKTIVVFFLLCWNETHLCKAIDAGDKLPIQYSVVGRIPLPPDSFTQGLVVDGDKLWLGTGQYGKSKLMELDLKTGKVLRSKKLLKSVFGEGVAVQDDHIIQLTWQSGWAYIYNKQTMKMVDIMPIESEGWGVTTNKDKYYISNGSHKIDIYSVKTKKRIDTIPVYSSGIPVSNLNELEWINGMILSNVWQSNRIVFIQPDSGEVIGYLDFSKLFQQEIKLNPEIDVLNGIAWDEKRKLLLISGKHWKNIYLVQMKNGPLHK